MSVYQDKLKEDINKLSSQREINILLPSKQKKQKDSINLNIVNYKNKEQTLNYGNYRIFIYNKKGDPLFLIGPDYGYFIFIVFLDLSFCIFLSGLITYISSFYVSLFGIILNLIQFIFVIICGFKNPGLPIREIQNEELIEKNPNKYMRCHLCHFIIDRTKNYVHCNICGCCCGGYDHHCPWTSKCVGRGNLFYFNGMLFMISIIFIYIIIAVICSKPNGKNK